MADARVLYIVMTLVLFGLVTWVITVSALPAYRRPARGPKPREALGGAGPAAGPSESGRTGAPAPPSHPPRREG